MGAAIAALEQLGRVLAAQPRPRIDDLGRAGQDPDDDLAGGGVLHRVADQVAQRHRHRRFRRVDHQLRGLFKPQLQRLAADLGAEGVQQLPGHLAHVRVAVPALVAREQQQGADQVGALLLRALDAQQPRLGPLVQLRAREQQLDRPADHRQRRAQFMADVGVEFAVALHHFGQARGVVVQRPGQLADLVIGEVDRQRLGPGVAAGALQAPGKLGHRAHHPRRRPPAQQHRQQRHHQHRAQDRALELGLAARGLGHVIGQEEPFLRRLAHRQLVGERLPRLVHSAQVVDAVGKVGPVRLVQAQGFEPVALDHPPDHLLHRQRRPAGGMGVIQARVLVDVLVQHVLDQRVLHPVARFLGQEREQHREPEAEQDERDDDAAAQAPPVAWPASGRRPRVSFRHLAARSDSRCRGGSGSAGWRTACRPSPAGRGCAPAASPNPAAPRPRPGSPAPGA